MKDGVKKLAYNSAEVNSDAVDRWMNRVRSERKRFFFESSYGPSLEIKTRQKNRFALALDDIRFLARWFLNILLVIKHFGHDIQREYDVSRIKQFRQMSQLLLKQRVMPVFYRSYRLFKSENWSKAGEYIYFHTASQLYISEKLFPDEMNLFLDKVLFSEFYQKKGFRTPGILAEFEHGSCLRMTDLAHLPNVDLFVKKRAGMKGEGAMLFRKENGFYIRGGSRFTPESLWKLLKERSKDGNGYILQRCLSNHESWKRFTSGALATVRIVTMRQPDSGTILTLAANLRLPVGDLEVDNTSAGGLVAPIDIESGILGTGASVNPMDGKFEFSIHPDTGEKVAGMKLPFWEEIVNYSLELHKHAQSPFIGWDIGLTEEGCSVLEGSLVWSGGLEMPGEQPLRNTDYPLLYEQWLRLAEEDESGL